MKSQKYYTEMEQHLTTSKNALTPIPATPLEMRTDPVRFPRINTMNREDAIAQMVEIVRAAAIYRGIHSEAQDVTNTAAAVPPADVNSGCSCRA